MGLFSDLFRFREAGQAPNESNVQEFGTPQRSLFTSSKVLTLNHDIDITDENGKVMYRAKTKFPSLHDKTDIFDDRGKQVSHFESKIMTLHARHLVTMADGTSFEISNELLHLVKDIINIEGLGWQIRGNIIGLNFQLYDASENVIAVISQKALSLHDKYAIDIYRAEYEPIAVTILVVLQHMIRDRENAASVSSDSD